MKIVEAETGTFFKNLAIGDLFNTGTQDAPHPYQGKQYMVFQKITKSKGKCVEQAGYGNTRGVGSTYTFGPFKTVWKQ